MWTDRHIVGILASSMDYLLAALENQSEVEEVGPRKHAIPLESFLPPKAGWLTVTQPSLLVEFFRPGWDQVEVVQVGFRSLRPSVF